MRSTSDRSDRSTQREPAQRELTQQTPTEHRDPTGQRKQPDRPDPPGAQAAPLSVAEATRRAGPVDWTGLLRTYLAFLGPMVLANVLQSLSGTLNGIFIGQMLGTEALAAAAGMFPLVFFFLSVVIGVGAGGSVLIGQAWGAREPRRVKEIAGTALTVGAVIGVAAALVGSLFAREGLVLLKTPPDVIDEAVRYARVMVITLPFLLVFVLYTQLLRGVSDTVTPLFALLLSTLVSLALTPALIAGWGGLPRLGVVAAAVANLVAFVLALAFLALYLRWRRHPIAPDATLIRALRVDPAILRLVLRIGVPTAIQMVVIALAGLVILALVNDYGSQAAAAYGAVNQVVNYVEFPAISVAITASILSAQAIGARRIDRITPILRTGLLLSIVLTGSLVLLGYVLSHRVLGLFITEPAVLALAERLMAIMLWSCILLGMQAVIAATMRASGTVLVPTAISAGAILLLQLPCAWLLGRWLGLDGVWMSYPVVFTVMLVLQTTYYWRVWRHRPIARLA